MPIAADRSYIHDMFIHQPADEGFRFCCKGLLSCWTINSGDPNSDDFALVTDRDLVATTNRDNRPVKFWLSRGSEAWREEGEQKKEETEY